jgi:hypothetical protein
VLSVGYLRDVIFKWIEEVKDEFPFEFDYAIEEEPLGTGGGIKLALDKVKDERAFVLNGDTFFDVDLMQLYDAHVIGKKAITLALKPMKNFDRYGTVNMEPITGTILSFNEKQYCEEYSYPARPASSARGKHRTPGSSVGWATLLQQRFAYQRCEGRTYLAAFQKYRHNSRPCKQHEVAWRRSGQGA